MLKITRALLATAALAGVPTIAAADDGMWDVGEGNWYVGVGLGANWIDSFDGNAVFPIVNPPLGPFTGNVPISSEFDTGWAMLGSVGYDWGSWRLEFELGYQEMSSSSFTFGPLTNVGSTDVTEFTQMFNLIWDIPFSDVFSLNLGAGLGGVQLNFDGNGAIAPASTFSLNNDDYVFAYQGIIGLSYEISDSMELFLDYRYVVVDSVEDAGTVLATGVPFTLGGDNVASQIALLGVRYHFTEPQPPPPPAQVEQQPPPQTPPKTFIVFFDFNKSSLTAEAQNVVSEAADAFKQTGSVRIKVSGHTDTVGSASYNQRLSERRAASVKAELVRLGVPDNVISTEGRGFTDLMVPTGPGVREPQNRRAVIDL